MAKEIKPTRSELINLKKRIKLAKSGHNLLKKKRDGLILEFFNILKKAKDIRSELVREYRTALEKINYARTIEGDLQIKSLALALRNNPEADVNVKNIMGVLVPQVNSDTSQQALLERGYGIFSGSSKVDEAATAYENVVDKILTVAEVEVTMKKLLQEIEKTKRKVNALERITIPGMEQQAVYIRLRLEEMERENFTRLKRIKK